MPILMEFCWLMGSVGGCFFLNVTRCGSVGNSIRRGEGGKFHISSAHSYIIPKTMFYLFVHLKRFYKVSHHMFVMECVLLGKNAELRQVWGEKFTLLLFL